MNSFPSSEGFSDLYAMEFPSPSSGGSNFLAADGKMKSLPTLSEADPMNGGNWIDFGGANGFRESIKQAQHLPQHPEDDDSSIPIGSDVDLGEPLTDLDDFSASQDLDSEWVDDLSALERMKELLGQEVSLRTAKFLSGRPKRTSISSSLSEDEDDSIQLELLHDRPASTSRSKMQSSKSSNMTASTSLMYGEKPKSKKSSKEDKKKKKKKKKSRSRDGDHSDSGDDAGLTYQPLGESDDPDPCNLLDTDRAHEDPFLRLMQG